MQKSLTYVFVYFSYHIYITKKLKIYNKFKNIDIDEENLRTQVNKIYDKLESLGITKEDVKGILGKLIDLVKSIIN